MCSVWDRGLCYREGDKIAKSLQSPRAACQIQRLSNHDDDDDDDDDTDNGLQ